MSEDYDDQPYVCPDCYAVGGAPCARDCPATLSRWRELFGDHDEPAEDSDGDE